MAAAQKLQSTITTPKPQQLVECRGALWRFLREEKGFWELELIRQGANFTEVPVRVWALPHLETNTLKVYDTSSELYQAPTSEQKQKSDLCKPLVHIRKANAISSAEDSTIAHTAAACAIDYKSWQFEPWNRISTELPFPRLLIADDVGLGKTTEAAIILAELARRRRADRTLIIAPQHLCEKWQAELFNRFGLSFEIFDRSTRERLAERGIANPWEVVERVIVSRDFVKRWENLKPLSAVKWDMVVIDEAHHFVKDHSGAESRLHEMAMKVAYESPGLLLLSATPFTGSDKEFKSLLGLLDPKFLLPGEASKWDPKNPFLVRRLKTHVKSFGEKMHDREIVNIHIRSEDLSSHERKAFAAVSEDLAERKQSRENHWEALMEEVIRKRLSSGWRAFLSTATSKDEYRKWFKEKTLTLAKNLVDSQSSAKLRKVSEFIRNLHKNDSQAKIVIFTEAIDSQEELFDFLTSNQKMSQDSVRLIDGSTDRLARMEIEDQFSNPNSPLKVLIATDTISEGKDLQHACHHLIQYELPWSIVKVEQRSGRIDRLQQQKVPRIINMILDLPETPDQRVVSRLNEKLRAAQSSLGSVSPILESTELDVMSVVNGELDVTELEAKIDESAQLLREFGYDVDTLTPVSAAPLKETNDHHERRVVCDKMLTHVGGSLSPYGKAKDEYLLSLPPGWQLPSLVLESFGYPNADSPWRVTFSPETYLKHEKFLMSGGDVRVPLQFISPIHPLMVQLESRFHAKLNRESYPVFVVQGDAPQNTAAVEFIVRSPKGRIVAQELRFFDLEKHTQIPAKLIEDVQVGSGNPTRLSARIWSKFLVFAESESRKFAEELETRYTARKREYLEEHKSFANLSHQPLLNAREGWLEDLWTVSIDQSHFQLTAAFIKREG